MKDRYKETMDTLCQAIRNRCAQRQYKEGISEVATAMARYPDAPEPHNLLGILYEKTGNHVLAMKHFQAASALDATYRPARFNMQRFASLSPKGRCAFDDADCPEATGPAARQHLVFDAMGVGHVIHAHHPY
jgi:hypothetical protein